MSFSRFSVLVVFLMMVTSAFVAIPAYNAGADEGSGGPYLNAYPKGSSGAPEDYEMSLDTSEGGANITVEGSELIDGTSYKIDWMISSLSDIPIPIASGVWQFSGGDSSASVQFFIGPDTLNDQDFDAGCYRFTGRLVDVDTDIVIEEETWPFSLDLPLSECGEGDGNMDSEEDWDIVSQDVTISMVDLENWNVSVDLEMSTEDSNNLRSEVSSMVCTDDDNVVDISESCFDYWLENRENHSGPADGGPYCPSGFTDDQCDIFVDECGTSNGTMACFGLFYEVCIADNIGDEFCHHMSNDDTALEFAQDFVERESISYGQDPFDIMAEFNLSENDGIVSGGLGGNDPSACEINWPEDSYYIAVYSFVSEYVLMESAGVGCFVDNMSLDQTYDKVAYDMEDRWNDPFSVMDFMWEVIAYEREDNTSAELVSYVENLISEMDFGGHEDAIDKAYYDSYIFNVSEDEAANYTVNIEYQQNATSGDWFSPAFVYLYEGHHTYPYFDADVADFPWIEGNHRVCEYTDTTEMYVECNNSISGLLEEGNYTMFITNQCNQDWHHEESGNDSEFIGYICEYGDYDLSVYNEDNDTHVDNIVGELTGDDDYFWLDEIHDDFRWESYEFHFFPFYETYNYQLVAGDDTAYFYSSQGDDSNLYVWLYKDSFDASNWSDNLLHISTGYEHNSDDDDYYSWFDLSKLEPGTYVFVTTATNTHGNGSHQSHIFDSNDTVIESWDGILCGDYYDSCDNPADDDERTYFTYNYNEYYQDMSETGVSDNNSGYLFFSALLENVTAYWDDEISEEEFADIIVDLFYLADFFTQDHSDDGPGDDGPGDDGPGDDGPGDASDCPFVNITFCAELWHNLDDSYEMGQEMAHYCLENVDAGCTTITAICADPSPQNVTICEVIAAFDHAAYHESNTVVLLDDIDGVMDPHDWVEFENFEFDEQYIIGNISDNVDKNITFSTAFELYFEDVNETLDNHTFELLPTSDMLFNCRTETGMAGEEMTVPFDDVNDGTEDCGDGADEPHYDDDGVEINWFDCHDGSEVAMSVVNDGTPDCPHGEDEGSEHSGMSVEFNLLAGYEILDCIDCIDPVFSDDNRSVSFDTEDEAFAIVFAEVSAPVVEEPVVEEPVDDLPECNHLVGISAGSYAFSPAELSINVGDTVCWQWANTTDMHNVIEIDVEYDADLNITEIMAGFSSGNLSYSGDFRHTFTEDDMTHYYVCEPHAQMGMVGKITVGAGSEEKEEAVESAVEESGLPSISFIVGILVLVGAAGLRRRMQ